MNALLVLGILVFLIVIHELGHFLVAKIFRVRVEEFGVGYPPRAFLLGRLGGTEYTLNWLPFGGFVRLSGENHESVKGKGDFAGSARIVQALILIAGVVMNVIAAWGLFAGALAVGIPHALGEGEDAARARLVVTDVVPGSPAASALITPGDEIIALSDEGGKEAGRDPQSVVEFVKARGGKPITVRYKRLEKEHSVIVHPAHAVVEESAQRPALGVRLALVSSESIPLSQALADAGPVTWDKLKSVVHGLFGMVEGALRGEAVLKDVVGPVGLVDVVGNASRHGLGTLLVLAGFISLNLAVVNLIPVPALDGGRLVLVAIEGMLGRNVSRRAVQIVNTLGVGLLVFLMVSVTYNDIVRLLA